MFFCAKCIFVVCQAVVSVAVLLLAAKIQDGCLKLKSIIFTRVASSDYHYDDRFSQFHSCGTYSVLSRSHSVEVYDIIIGRLPWQPDGQPDGIKFTQCVSDQKSTFSPLQEKLCVGSKNYRHLLELSRRSLSACKVWMRSNYARRL